MATSRLRKELQLLMRDPPPGIIAEPKESDILVWFYAIRGPEGTPYEGGVYIGKLKFPSEYPMKAPDIYMLTPSGRFEINKKLCLSMSSFHQDTWVPSWAVSSIIQGIQSFMPSSELTTGGMEAPESLRRKLAEQSIEFNRKNYPDLFGGNIDEAFAKADQAVKEAREKAHAASARAPVLRSVATRPVRKERRVIPEAAQDDEEEEFENEEEEKVPELSPEEIEKRRKKAAVKNAKTREKQKAKKAAAADETAKS